MQAEFGTQMDIGKGSIGGDLDRMIAQCTEQHGEVRVVGFKVVKLRNVHQEISLYVLVLWGPDFFATFVDDGVLVRVVVGSGARQGGEEIGEEVSFWENREAKGAVRRSWRGWGRDIGDGGGNDGQREVLD